MRSFGYQVEKKEAGTVVPPKEEVKEKEVQEVPYTDMSKMIEVVGMCESDDESGSMSSFIGDIIEKDARLSPAVSVSTNATAASVTLSLGTPSPGSYLVPAGSQNQPPAISRVTSDDSSTSWLPRAAAPSIANESVQTRFNENLQTSGPTAMDWNHMEEEKMPEPEAALTVGLAQVTLFPSHNLKVEEDESNFLPDAECLMLTMFGLCLDEDKMLNLAAASERIRQNEKKPYVPPPVTWSQPVIIVPPDDTYKDKPTRKHVKFGNNDDDGEEEAGIYHKPTSPRWALLHGRVARALGIQDGDIVVARFHNQTKRHFLKASVDDRASFNVVMEADFKDVTAVSMPQPRPPAPLKRGRWSKKKGSSKAPNIERIGSNDMSVTSSNTAFPLRSVELKVETEEDETGDMNRNARFHLTPVDRLKHGVLYFDGSLTAITSKGLVAGTGFNIYSCSAKSRRRNGDVDYESDDGYLSSGSSRSYGDKKRRRNKIRTLPSNRTRLVSSFRYLGRPFCPNHAEFSALIEGLEWLFRFQFDKVTIVGDPDIVAAVQCRDLEDDELPQLKRAAKIARGMIDAAEKNGVEVEYFLAEDDENWEATELAEMALTLQRNETRVVWDNVREAKTIELDQHACHYQVQSSFTYSESTENRRQHLVERLAASQEETASECSLLKGELLLDEEFKLPDKPSGSQDRRNSSGSNHGSCSTEPTCNALKPGEEDDDASSDSNDEGEETKEEEEDGVSGELAKRGSNRWQKFAKALRFRRNKGGYNHLEEPITEAPSMISQPSLGDDRSTWGAASPHDISDPSFADSRDDNDDNKEEEKVAEATDILEDLMNDNDSQASSQVVPATSNTSTIKQDDTFAGSLCFMLDMDLFQGAQLVADDFKKLITGFGDELISPTASKADARQPPEAQESSQLKSCSSSTGISSLESLKMKENVPPNDAATTSSVMDGSKTLEPAATAYTKQFAYV